MTFPYKPLVVDISGFSSVVVTFTDAHGGTPTVYADAFGVTPVSLPDTITARKTYFLPHDGPWTTSAKVSGVEMAGSTLSLSGGAGTVSLGPAGRVGFGTAEGTISPGNDSGLANVLSVFGRTGTVTAASGDYTAEQIGSSGAFDVAENLAEGVPATMRTNLGLGNAATANFGTTTGTVAQGNDARIPNPAETGDLIVGAAAGQTGTVSAAEAQSFGVPIPVVVDGSAGGLLVRIGAVTVVSVPTGEFPDDSTVFPSDTNGNLYQPAVNDPNVIGVDPTGPTYVRGPDGTWSYNQAYVPVMAGRLL